MNAPELVKERLVKGWVYMSSISDPYQPIEKQLKLTRKILENLDKKTKLSIQTKSDLVLRDIDLFKQFKDIEVGFTINSFIGKAKTTIEPGSSSNNLRIRALKKLKENGIKTFVFISPIIPDLIDLKKVINDTKEFTDYYWFEFINTRGADKEFMEILRKQFPESYGVLTNKENYSGFMRQARNDIASQKINVKGIEIH